MFWIGNYYMKSMVFALIFPIVIPSHSLLLYLNSLFFT